MLQYDGPLIRYLVKAADMITLNFLWILFSLPVVTFGASTAAAHYVALKLVRDEGTSVVSMFIHAFRRNLLQGCMAGILFLAAGSILGIDLWLVFTGKIHVSSLASLLFTVLLWLLSFFYLMISVYVWALMARFENTIRQTVLNACILSVANIKSTLMMICWDVSLISAAVVCMAFLPQAAAPMLLFGIPSLFVLNAIWVRPVLDQCEEKENVKKGELC